MYALEDNFGNQIENVSMFQGYHKYTGNFRQDFCSTGVVLRHCILNVTSMMILHNSFSIIEIIWRFNHMF